MIALKIRKGVSLGLGSPPLLPPFLHLPLPCLARSPTGFSLLRGIFLFLASAKKEKLSLSRLFFVLLCQSDPMVTSLLVACGKDFILLGCWGFSETEDFVLFSHGGEASRAEPLADVTDTKSLGTGRGDLR